MISKNKISLIRSLDQKKSREKTGLFLVEGDKICVDLLNSNHQIKAIYFLKNWEIKNRQLLKSHIGRVEMIEVTEPELKKLSLLNSPNQVVAMVYQQKLKLINKNINKGPVILLDNLQDPGNLGTIIRTADWFGFHTIIASANTVDIYNPKVIQAAMGSVFRINYFKENLENLLIHNEDNNKWPVYATVLDGKSLYENKLLEKGFYLFGNEANGVSLRLHSFSSAHITIPQVTSIGGQQTADSLNVSIAAAVVMAEYVRQKEN